MKIDAHRAVREAGAGGDFGTSHAFHQAKNEGFAIGFGKSEDGRECRVGFGGRVWGRRNRKRVRMRIGARSFVSEFIRGHGTAMKVDGAVAGDRSEPTRKFGYFAERDEPREGLKENVLEEVVDVGVRNAREQNAMDHAGVAGIENAEGGAIALLCGPDEGVVGGVDVRRGGHGEAAGE